MKHLRIRMQFINHSNGEEEYREFQASSLERAIRAGYRLARQWGGEWEVVVSEIL